MTNEEKVLEAQLENAINEKPDEKPKLRQIILETDGNSITFAKVEVAGDIELFAILQRALAAIQHKMEGK